MNENSKKTDRVLMSMAALLLLVLVFAMYQPALHGEPVWDDIELISRHQIAQTDAWFENTFTKPYLSDGFYYRPIPLLTMVINAAGGMEDFAYYAHLSNLLFFYINILLVLVLAVKIAGSFFAGILSALFFTLHPAMIEPAAWISGRCDLLFTLFVLAALVADLYLKNHLAKILAIAFCFLMAALSKEMAVIFPGLYIIWRLFVEDVPFRHKEIKSWFLQKNNIALLGALFLTGIIYLCLRSALQGALFASMSFMDKESMVGGPLSHIFLVGKTFFYYVALSLFPHYELTVLYDTVFPVPIDGKGVLVGLLMLPVAVWLISSKKMQSRTRYVLLILMLLFIPISNLKVIVTWNNIIYLRYLVLPIAMIAILAIPLIYRWCLLQTDRLQKVILGFTALWAVSACLNVVVTVPLWTHDLLLWKWVAESKKQVTHYAWDNYSRAALIAKDWPRCIEAVNNSIAVNAHNIKSQANGATCSYYGGSYANVRVYSNKIINGLIEADPVTRSKMITLSVMADIKNGMENWREMQIWMKKALEYDAGNRAAQYILFALQVKMTESPEYTGISDSEKLDALMFIGEIGLFNSDEMMALEKEL